MPIKEGKNQFIHNLLKKIRLMYIVVHSHLYIHTTNCFGDSQNKCFVDEKEQNLIIRFSLYALPIHHFINHQLALVTIESRHSATP